MNQDKTPISHTHYLPNVRLVLRSASGVTETKTGGNRQRSHLPVGRSMFLHRRPHTLRLNPHPGETKQGSSYHGYGSKLPQTDSCDVSTPHLTRPRPVLGGRGFTAFELVGIYFPSRKQVNNIKTPLTPSAPQSNRSSVST